MTNLEKRVLELESKMFAIEERRRRMWPERLNDPEMQMHLGQSIKKAVERWELGLHLNGDQTKATFVELQKTHLERLHEQAERAKQREGAEIAAAIQFYLDTGESPEGYEIVDEENV